MNGSASNIIAFTNNSTSKGYIFHTGTNLEILNATTSGVLQFYTETTERARITSGGNVLIGTTTSTGAKLEVNGGITVAGTSALADNQLRIRSIGDANHAILYNGTINGPLSYGYLGSGLGWTEGGSAQIALMNVRGNVLIGTTTIIGPVQGKLDVLYDGITLYGMNLKTTYSSGGLAISFNNSSGSQVGNINTTFSATAYNTSSDYRLKTDLKDFNGIDLINKIKTYDFKWKSENSRSYGVIAHELQEVIDYVVHGKKDSVTMQGVDYSKLVPIMVKAIQEQQAQIQELKNKLL